MISSTVSLGVWAAGQLHPRTTRPMEVVTISIYVIPETSSCTMWLVHIVAIVGLPITSGCMCSRGTLEMVAGNGPPCRQAITSLKPRGGTTTCIGPGDMGEGESHSTCSACNHSSALWHWALLASELWWWYLHFNSPKVGEVCPTVVTGQEGAALSPNWGTGLGEPLSLPIPHVAPGAWLVL